MAGGTQRSAPDHGRTSDLSIPHPTVHLAQRSGQLELSDQESLARLPPRSDCSHHYTRTVIRRPRRSGRSPAVPRRRRRRHRSSSHPRARQARRRTGVRVRNYVPPATNEHDRARQTREVADDVVVAVLGTGEGQTGASLPTVTAQRSCDTRYPPNRTHSTSQSSQSIKRPMDRYGVCRRSSHSGTPAVCDIRSEDSWEKIVGGWWPMRPHSQGVVSWLRPLLTSTMRSQAADGRAGGLPQVSRLRAGPRAGRWP